MEFLDPQMLESEKNLVVWIKKFTHILFSEPICWHDSDINADLVGKDSNDNPVIVEVKLWYDEMPNRKTQEHTCVGQIIHYTYDYANANADTYTSENTRLFIIAQEKSKIVECCCELLRAHGFNIQHLSVMDAIRKETDRKLTESKRKLKDAGDRK